MSRPTPEECEVTEEDRELADRLIAAGWKSISNRYCTVELVDVPMLFANVATFHDGTPEWLKAAVVDLYQRACSTNLWHRAGNGTVMTLTISEFKAFKQAGGQSA